MATIRILKNTLSDVPGGWTYTVPETSFIIPKQYIYVDLIAKVIEHYKVNGLDVPEDIELLVQSQISKRVPLPLTKEVSYGQK